jgi:hypothetical protein
VTKQRALQKSVTKVIWRLAVLARSPEHRDRASITTLRTEDRQEPGSRQGCQAVTITTVSQHLLARCPMPGRLEKEIGRKGWQAPSGDLLFSAPCLQERQSWRESRWESISCPQLFNLEFTPPGMALYSLTSTLDLSAG